MQAYRAGDMVETPALRGTSDWDYGRVLGVVDAADPVCGVYAGWLLIGWSGGTWSPADPADLAPWDGEQRGAPAPECTDD